MVLYGEIEFSFGLLKSLLVVILVITSLVVDVGGGPSHEVYLLTSVARRVPAESISQFIGGRNWRPHPIKDYLIDGPTGRFLAVWSVLSASFASI